MSDAASSNAGKTRGRPFTAGNPGGPGRPRGSRSSVAMALDARLEADVDVVYAAAMERVRDGDTKMIVALLDRIWPAVRERRISLALPALETLADARAAQALIVEAVADGRISAAEGADLNGVVAKWIETAVANDVERKLIEAERRSRPGLGVIR